MCNGFFLRINLRFKWVFGGVYGRSSVSHSNKTIFIFKKSPFPSCFPVKQKQLEMAPKINMFFSLLPYCYLLKHFKSPWSLLRALLPNWPFHIYRASNSIDRCFQSTDSSSIDGFWGSKIEKGSVGWLVPLKICLPCLTTFYPTEHGTILEPKNIRRAASFMQLRNFDPRFFQWKFGRVYLNTGHTDSRPHDFALALCCFLVTDHIMGTFLPASMACLKNINVCTFVCIAYEKRRERETYLYFKDCQRFYIPGTILAGGKGNGFSSSSPTSLPEYQRTIIFSPLPRSIDLSWAQNYLDPTAIGCINSKESRYIKSGWVNGSFPLLHKISLC